jgi:undecaprenyl-diphosphatase
VSYFEAVVLGIVQGLTEFLPISSNAHLRIVGAAFGWNDPGAAFTAITQIGTELAVLIYFARDIGRIVTAWVSSLFNKERRRDPDARLGWLIIVGSIPIVLLGLAFQTQIETKLRDLRIIAIALVVFSLFLYVADRVGAKKRELDDLTVGHGIIYGLAQSLALIRRRATRSCWPSPRSWAPACTRSTRLSRAACTALRSCGGRRSWPPCSPSPSVSR